ncbi:polysaccharide pyruvyl transferase family protein [Caldifermentibacillus hisashii]|uniref:polysaccharide pyruvyl transferase family protein n=1 Tax=Caldifermentibacillus hisashii TaxID=996558 RepID=UPI001C0FF5DE|nr:polysaccharide pyruvyl transferase family protein [Caldifermentibacillus hisashii]MBU5343510.1 polysaccharide pyruvyl transferase family protein [Caldifermentibacillus hisashii]
MKKAIVVSFYKSNNIGDLALSKSIKDIVLKSGYEVTSYDFGTIEKVKDETNNLNTNKMPDKCYSKIIHNIYNLVKYFIGDHLFGYLAVISKRKKWKAFILDLMESDVIVIGGGNMLLDKQIYWPSLLYKYSSLAKGKGKKSFLVYVGAEKVTSRISHLFFKKALNKFDYVSVRDPESLRICQEITKSPIEETIDPVFQLKPPENNFFGITDELNIGICVLSSVCFKDNIGFKKYLDSLEKMIFFLSEHKSFKIDSFYLFSTDAADFYIVDQLKKRIDIQSKNITVKVTKPTTLSNVINLYSQFTYLIGGRMHSMIIAQKCLLPYCGVIWQSKIRGFSKVVEREKRIFELSEFINHQYIAGLIIQDLKNIEVIKRYMSIKNSNLESTLDKTNFLK